MKNIKAFAGVVLGLMALSSAAFANLPCPEVSLDNINTINQVAIDQHYNRSIVSWVGNIVMAPGEKVSSVYPPRPTYPDEDLTCHYEADTNMQREEVHFELRMSEINSPYVVQPDLKTVQSLSNGEENHVDSGPVKWELVSIPHNAHINQVSKNDGYAVVQARGQHPGIYTTYKIEYNKDRKNKTNYLILKLNKTLENINDLVN